MAIPVRLGDAFYLEKGTGSVLVDGGISGSGFSPMFRQHVNRHGADIVVCTHNDADHANGIIGFLNEGLECREVWLPGRWSGVLEQLSLAGPGVFHAIIDGAFTLFERVQRDRWFSSSLEEVGNALAAEDDTSQRLEEAVGTEDEHLISRGSQGEQEDATDYTEGLVPLLEVGIDEWELWRREAVLASPVWPPAHAIGGWRLIREAIEAAQRIGKIAQVALSNGIPIRWFEHAPGRPGGGIPDFLRPVSAREILRVSPTRPLFEGLALTTVNKESLVFYSPPDKQSPGVLFCADSDLRSMRLPIQGRDLITAPHHGSEDNRQAYEVIRSSVPDISSLIFVRSDSRNSTRPGGTYRGLPARRFCTVCDTGPSKQRVLLIGRSRTWAAHTSGRACQC